MHCLTLLLIPLCCMFHFRTLQLLVCSPCPRLTKKHLIH
nr:MAG TPA: hypothetical protein [Bacteriophage sp.]